MSAFAKFTWKSPHNPDEHTFPHINSRLLPRLTRKRKLADSEDSPRQHPEHAASRKFASYAKLKRVKTPKIQGLSLPVGRVIEVLDHTSLQDLLHQIVQTHPEVAQTITKMAQRPSTRDLVELIRQKAKNIIDHLPYKCDTESDYSYIRIKPYLTELLHTISDFILSLLPPMELSLASACELLDVITRLMHDLPNFTNNEFQYTKAVAYEQIANLWFIVLAHHNGDDISELDETGAAVAHNVEHLIEFAKAVEEMDLQKTLDKHNEMTRGKFLKVAEYVRAGMEQYEELNRQISGGGSIINDFITVDYSNYLISARTSH